MMEVLVDSREVDAIPCELMGCWFFDDVRPLRGTAALLDWKLDAALSRLITAGRITGQWGEQMLLWPTDGLAAGGVLMVGLGSRHSFDSGLIRQAARLMAQTMHKLGIGDLCTALPGVGSGGLDTVLIAEHFLEGLLQAVPADFEDSGEETSDGDTSDGGTCGGGTCGEVNSGESGAGEAAFSAMTPIRPRIVCPAGEVDEVLLGFQTTKVGLKGRVALDIRQVTP